MQNILRRGGTFYARLFIPADRWADVGKARGASGGITREVVRSLQTGDLREARKRLRPALAAIQADVDAKLAAAGRRPLTEWSAGWIDRALFLRAALQDAGDKIVQSERIIDSHGEEVVVVDTERDFLLETIGEETERLAKLQGDAVAASFRKAATTDKLTLHEASALWLAEQTGARRVKTIEGHRRVLKLLEGFLRDHHNLPSLVSTTFDDVTRRMAGDFIAWRVAQVSPAAVKREASATMGLWRWGVRRGHTDLNPWADQTHGLSSAKDDESPTKRAFSDAEVVILLRATGTDWAPNGGGYGATLWDATRLAMLTGLRAGELADLRVCDVIEGGTAVAVCHGKRGKTKSATRVVPLPQVAQRVLAARLASLPDRSPAAPLWPEVPVLGLTNSRGAKLSDRWRMAKERLLPDAKGVDLHSLRRTYATLLEAAMNAGGQRVTPAVISALMGQKRGTLALDVYSSGPGRKAAQAAVAELETLGFPVEVVAALVETQDQRPAMVRFAPVAAAITVAPTKAAPTKRGRADLGRPLQRPGGA